MASVSSRGQATISRGFLTGAEGASVLLLGSQCTHMSSESGSEKKRVQFRAPSGLVDRADALAAVFETDRTDILISALREYLRDAAHADEVKQEIAEAFYDDEITFAELKALVGHEEAANFRLLKEQLTDEFVDDVAAELGDS